MILNVRVAQNEDLTSLLELYKASGFSAPATQNQIPDIWEKMIQREGNHIIVGVLGDKIVSSCTLIVAPNLLRNGQSHGFLENVATHPDYRGNGYGGYVVQYALAKAWEDNCYHVMMQSGREDERVHKFYRAQGFRPNLRTAYVIRQKDLK